MLENKKIRSILSLLLILNFILIIMCLVRIKFSYTGALEYTNTASNQYKDLYTKKINSDIIGSINLGNKTFLLIQTDNNNYYLSHNYEKKEDRFGAIFVDYRCSLLDDTNCYIYGHSSKDYNLPFNILYKYQDKDFFNSNNIITINYKGYDLTYEIVGVTDKYDNLDKFLYIQTCNESANGNIILVAKKV